jgi:putative membrane protein
MTWSGGVMWWVMPIVVIAVAATLIAAGLVLMRRLTPGAREDAVAILEHRYARGEIDGDEYRRRRQLLTGEDL